MELTSLLPDPLWLSDRYANDSAHAVDLAKMLGLDVIFGTPTLLQLDIDDKDRLLKAHIALTAAISDRILHIEEITYTVSKGGEGWHLYIRLSVPIEMSAKRSMIQATLGSDNIREMLGVARAERGDPNPILFWERKGEPRRPYGTLYEEVIKPLELAWKEGIKPWPKTKTDRVVGKVKKKMIKAQKE